MKKTTNYQLNQWDATDRILREDFNADNAKIDAAIAAVREAVPYRLIRCVTTSAAADQIDMDVSGIDFTQYLKIEVFFHSPDYTGALTLRVNNISTNSYTYNEISGNQGSSSMYNTQLAYLFGNGEGYWQFAAPVKKQKVFCICSTYNSMSIIGYQQMAPCTWGELKTLNFIGAAMPAETKIYVCGVRA